MTSDKAISAVGTDIRPIFSEIQASKVGQKMVQISKIFKCFNIYDILKKANHSKEFRMRWFRQLKESTDTELDVVAASDGLPSVYCTVTISRSSV